MFTKKNQMSIVNTKNNKYLFFLQARRVDPDPSQLRQEPTVVMLTLNGSQSPISGPLAPARPVLDKGNQRIMLVLTPTNQHFQHYDLINKDSDLQQAQTDYDYLSVNGHEIWILDFDFYVDFLLPRLFSLISSFSFVWHKINVSKPTRIVFKHSVFCP